ncbi:hypothetical protein RR46_11304 [Papilio xuthus]|uniref:Protein kinase domain-containing protein n=1 Tax=Papilio xuthus TaxID=66420 RepID=A0A194PQ71_PAPXU|nr:hypothetical protein RR46_11304 [Papilio xuthus]
MSVVKGKLVKMEVIQVGEYEFTKQDIIGHGAFAMVYKGRKRRKLIHFNGDQHVVIVTLKPNELHIKLTCVKEILMFFFFESDITYWVSAIDYL